jgi:hypothetical protein
MKFIWTIKQAHVLRDSKNLKQKWLEPTQPNLFRLVQTFKLELTSKLVA